MAVLFPGIAMTPGQLFGAYLAPPFDPTICGSTETINPTTVTVFHFGAFKRVWVTYMYKGTATIFWELERGFPDPGPYTFQLQASHGGTPRADDWFNIGGITSMFFATDTGQKMFGKTTTLHYRVLLYTPKGCYVSPIANVLGALNKHDWLLVREMLRQEQLNHRIFSSERGYLLKARRYGTQCSRDHGVAGSFTNEIIDTHCPLCYGTGYLDGYYPPTEYYALLPGSRSREFRDMQTGTAKRVIVQARFLGTLPLVQGDAWVSIDSDERYYVHTVTEAAVWKSVPVVYVVELRLAPFTDALYDVPLPPYSA